MSALTRPRHRLVEVAINLARQWCYGHVIDGSPALGHALKVARKVDEHLSTASPDLIAAVILHDAPYFAPDSDDLEQLLTLPFNQFGGAWCPSCGGPAVGAPGRWPG